MLKVDIKERISTRNAVIRLKNRLNDKTNSYDKGELKVENNMDITKPTSQIKITRKEQKNEELNLVQYFCNPVNFYFYFLNKKKIIIYNFIYVFICVLHPIFF